MHDPAHADAVRAGRARGGAAASKLRALQGRRSKLDTPAALLRFCATVVYDVVEHRLEPDCARVALYGLSIQKSLLEVADIEGRLRALEAQASTGRQRWRR